MIEKLRLLLFKDCNRSCPGCCNKDWDLDALPQVQSFVGYSTIILTGGEPMLNPNLVLETIKNIKKENQCPIIMYTAKTNDPMAFIRVLNEIEGVTLTLHDKEDIKPFVVLNEEINKHGLKNGKSLRLNVFKGVKTENLDVSGWLVKSDMVWIKDCPLPKDEIFMRL